MSVLSTPYVDVKIVNHNIINSENLPKYQTDGSVGLDLLASIEMPKAIHPGKRVLIPTGIAIDIKDKNTGAFIFARSGLSSKYGITLINGVGVVDSDYQGEILVALTNQSSRIYILQSCERIAQLVFMPIKKIKLKLVDEFDSVTNRGANGFGSTG